MNKFMRIFIILVLFSSSCKKETSECGLASYQSKRQEIVGKWAIRAVHKHFSQDSLLFEFFYWQDLNYEFLEDGTGFMPSQSLDVETDILEWIYQENPEKVMIRRVTDEGEAYPGGMEFYSIIEKREDYQHWIHSDTAGFWTPDTIYQGHVEIDWKLHRR